MPSAITRSYHDRHAIRQGFTSSIWLLSKTEVLAAAPAAPADRRLLSISRPTVGSSSTSSLGRCNKTAARSRRRRIPRARPARRSIQSCMPGADQLAHAPITIRRAQVIDALELQQLPAGEDLVDRHLLSHVAEHAANGPRSFRASMPATALAGIGGQQRRGCGVCGLPACRPSCRAALWHSETEVVECLHSPVRLLQMGQLQQGH